MMGEKRRKERLLDKREEEEEEKSVERMRALGGTLLGLVCCTYRETREREREIYSPDRLAARRCPRYSFLFLLLRLTGKWPALFFFLFLFGGNDDRATTVSRTGRERRSMRDRLQSISCVSA
jgi:hypothetical protein